MRKILDLSDECVETISIAAIKTKPKKSNFKKLAQEILEREAEKLKKP